MEEDSNPPFPPKAPPTDSKVEFTRTTSTVKPESRLFGVSVRGLLVLLIVITVCYMAMADKKVVEPLYSLVLLTVGYYFGQNTKQK